MTLKMIKRSVIAAVVIGALCAPVFAAGAQSPALSNVGFSNAKVVELKAPPPPPPKRDKPKPKPPKKAKKPKPPKPPKAPKKAKKPAKRPPQPPPPPPPRR